MSAFDLDKLIHQVWSQENWLTLANAGGEALDSYDLTEEERRALLDGDIKALYALGVNGYLLLRYGGWVGFRGPEIVKAFDNDLVARIDISDARQE